MVGPVRHALILFLASLGIRIAFLAGLPQPLGWCAPAYQGDAPRWQQLASGLAAQQGDPEAILPFRPPAMTWLVQLLGEANVASPWCTRSLLLLLGACIAPLLYLALSRHFAERTARLAGWIAATAHSLIVLDSGVHSETPYLFLFVVSLLDWDRMRSSGNRTATIRWALLQALACLFRADHLLAVALQLGWLCAARTPRAVQTSGIALATIAAALVPWQWHAHRQIEQFDTANAPPMPPPGLPWDDDAVAAVRTWPAFAQGGNAMFVAATVQARGGTRVRKQDLAIVQEAYGCAIEPLQTPLIALYGPLNFFLGNATGSDGSFAQTALDRLPPLSGGPTRYPPGFAQALPRGGQLSMGYPPHLSLIQNGYRIGLREMAADPLAAALRILNKLTYGWQGAASGIGSRAVPLGTEGPRRPVDLVTPHHVLAAVWRAALLGLAVLGAWRLRREPQAAVYLLWIVGKVAILAAFFGYARLGALMLPACALLWAHALVTLTARMPTGWLRRLGQVALAAIVVLEIARLVTPNPPFVNGRPSAPFVPNAIPDHGAALVRY